MAHGSFEIDYQSTGGGWRIISKPIPKPCPFCKCGKVMAWHIGHYDKPWVVECCQCQAQGPHADTEDEAFDLWNKRKYGTIGE